MAKKEHGRTADTEFRLMIEPDDGIKPLLHAINEAKTSIEMLIFRFDRKDVEDALVQAVKRGVAVQALIACTNRGGERNLRRLEARLLEAGVTVSRTANDLCRYHGKMMIIDKEALFLLAFNFTALDVDRSRSFGVITTSPKLVQEAGRLFDADSNRRDYSPELDNFLVSPLNARTELAKFIEGAKKELQIYDPGLSDPQMVRLLEERTRAGVQVYIIGTLKRASGILAASPLAQLRLHTRTVIRDGRDAFVGSQSLRAAELDGRREIGLILSDKGVVRSLGKTFEADWKLTEASADRPSEEHLLGDKLAKKVAKAVTRELPPVAEVIASVAEDISAKKVNLDGIDLDDLEDTVREAVKTAVKETIQEAAHASGNEREHADR